MKDKVKYECVDCGCFFWVEDRNDFECPNCKGSETPASSIKKINVVDVIKQEYAREVI